MGSGDVPKTNQQGAKVQGQRQRCLELIDELRNLPCSELKGALSALESLTRDIREAVDKQSDGIDEGSIECERKHVIIGERLRNLPSGLLGKMIPAERVVMAMQVSKWMREELTLQLREVVLRSRPDPQPNLLFTDMSINQSPSFETACVMHEEEEGPEVTSADVALSLAQFQNSSVILQWRCDAVEELFAALETNGSANKHVIHIDLSHVISCSQHASLLGASLASCRELAGVCLASCRLDAPTFAAVAAALEHCHALTHLDLGNNMAGDAGAAALASTLNVCTRLQLLDLHANDVRAGGIARLAGPLGKCGGLRHLALGRNHLRDEGATALTDALIECVGIEHLDLSDNGIDQLGGEVLAELVGKCAGLTHLDLGRDHVGDTGATRLAEALGRHAGQGGAGLRHLNLSRNQVGPGGFGRLARAVGECPRLVHLDLSENRAGAVGAGPLAEQVGRWAALQHLDVSGCELRGEGAVAVAAGLRQCAGLRFLELGGSELGDEGAAAVEAALRACRGVQHLGLRGCGLTHVGARRVGAAVEESSGALTRLDLADNRIGDKGADAVAAALRGSTQLRFLKLKGCELRFGGLMEVMGAVRECEGLRGVDLSQNWGDDDRRLERKAALLERCLSRFCRLDRLLF